MDAKVTENTTLLHLKAASSRTMKYTSILQGYAILEWRRSSIRNSKKMQKRTIHAPVELFY